MQCRALCDTYEGGVLQITVMTSSHNKGYGSGHNQALHAVQSRIHLLLNPDVELDTEAIRIAMETLANRPDIALLAPIGLSETGRRRIPREGLSLGLGARCARLCAAMDQAFEHEEYRAVRTPQLTGGHSASTHPLSIGMLPVGQPRTPRYRERV